MKFLLLNQYPFEGSGSGTYTKNIASLLTRHGHQVCAIIAENEMGFYVPHSVRAHPVFFTNKENIPGARKYNFPCYSSHPRSDVTFDDLTEEQLEEYMSIFDKAIWEEITNFQPDLIHCQHLWLQPYLVSFYNVPYIITTFGTEFAGMDSHPQFMPYIRRAVEKAEAILAISQNVAEETRRRFPEYAYKVKTMIGGFDSWKFYPVDCTRESVLGEYGVNENLEYMIVFVGTLDYLKGTDVLLNAAAKYEKLYPGRIMTIVAGDGALSDELKHLSGNLGLEHVHFLGHVPNNRLKRLYSVSDLCVVSSRKDPLGAVAVEALACGVPVVASDQGALKDIIVPEVGTLTESQNPDSLVEGIRRELNMPDRASRRKAAAKYARDNYSEDVIIGQIMEEYAKICAD